ncbi:30S ribosomal protein S9 [Candidatus Beckwithbacteria bacterium]|nr:30S ribosomal protein S9 [Candidatus Beckwithbacteria bacterium]
MADTIAKPKIVKKDYVAAVGRRKEATARVRLYLTKKGEIEVNGKRIEEYFPGEIAKSMYAEPLRTCNLIGKHAISIKVNGSGKNSQLGAIVHGMARAIDKIDPEKYHPILKKRGLLTRDPRAKERRKAGMGGKARAKKQSPRR